MSDTDETTDILTRGLDRPDAFEQLIPRVYGELRRLASIHLAKERQDNTLQTTELVHEVFLKLVQQQSVQLKDRLHFISVAAVLMRRILVDHARRRRADKRISPDRLVPMDEEPAAESPNGSPDEVDILALDRALDRLAELDRDRARVVELRYFGGLTLPETAEALGISEASVSRRWRAARLWLKREMRRAAPA